MRRYRDHHGKRRLVVLDPGGSGVEGFMETATHDCYSCTEWGDYGGNKVTWGCASCGYTGKRRVRAWVPFVYSDMEEAGASWEGW